MAKKDGDTMKQKKLAKTQAEMLRLVTETLENNAANSRRLPSGKIWPFVLWDAGFQRQPLRALAKKGLVTISEFRDSGYLQTVAYPVGKEYPHADEVAKEVLDSWRHHRAARV